MDNVEIIIEINGIETWRYYGTSENFLEDSEMEYLESKLTYYLDKLLNNSDNLYD